MGPESQQLAGCQPEPFCCLGSNLGGEGAAAGDQKQAAQALPVRMQGAEAPLEPASKAGERLGAQG